jgi:hypothetical protein
MAMFLPGGAVPDPGWEAPVENNVYHDNFRVDK